MTFTGDRMRPGFSSLPFRVAIAGVSEAEAQQQSAEPKPASEVNQAIPLTKDVFFHKGDIDRGLCNNGWIIIEDYVLVIDANFPAGARVILPKIRAITSKPIRFAFDIHHHGDHAYGKPGLDRKRRYSHRAHRCDTRNEALRNRLLR